MDDFLYHVSSFHLNWSSIRTFSIRLL